MFKVNRSMEVRRWPNVIVGSTKSWCKGRCWTNRGFYAGSSRGYSSFCWKPRSPSTLAPLPTSAPKAAKDTATATNGGGSKPGLAPLSCWCPRTGKGSSPRACSLATSETKRRLPWRLWRCTSRGFDQEGQGQEGQGGDRGAVRHLLLQEHALAPSHSARHGAR